MDLSIANREARIQALCETLNASIAAGGSVGEAELDAALDAVDRALADRFPSTEDDRGGRSCSSP
ncbi:hypothetical protein MKK67_02275 [Methylobacterium sp. J-072]|uniref:hypothetical protein n=1 Tax=Methylobacterium sp. J-072 TaxID=2836651 RepID=UPI001FB9C3C7|nr:hypothetical protein [Methylobacterium sp. J-072]MCJ2091340.1 hypothetical protein [Methylobacterium sp. J-072]